jgi:hypothetical protein
MRNRRWLPEAQLVDFNVPAALEDLRRAILSRHAEYPRQRQFDSMRWFADSREVLHSPSKVPLAHQFVAGEDSDTPYLRTAEFGKCANFTLGSDDLVVAYGVNHAATGLATYSSVSVYGDWITYPDGVGDDPYIRCPPSPQPYPYVYGCSNYMWNGVIGMNSDSKYFKSSAELYLGPKDQRAKYLYAIKIRRAASKYLSDDYTLIVPSQPEDNPSTDPRKGPAYAIPLERPITLGYRAYLNPATNAGPAYEDIVYDRAIWFGQKAGTSAQCDPYH